MIDIDESDIARWAAKANADQLHLLVGAEYSDANDIWLIEVADENGLELFNVETGRRMRRAFSFFASGAFAFSFSNEASGKVVKDLIHDSLSEFDRRILNARNVVSSHGFLVSDFDGDADVMKVATAIGQFEHEGKVPAGENWGDIHEILLRGERQSLMRCGAKLVAVWIDGAESRLDGCFDLFRRVLLAVLYRHTNQLAKALEVSDVVKMPQVKLLGGQGSIAVLCTTRAAALMDLAERSSDGCCALIQEARRSADRAYAISGGGESKEVMMVYSRLKALEKRCAR